jgi:hypothetical protein
VLGGGTAFLNCLQGCVAYFQNSRVIVHLISFWQNGQYFFPFFTNGTSNFRDGK